MLTDRRLKRLTDQQIEVLLLHHLNSPSEEAMKEAYHKRKRRTELEKTIPVEDIKKMGYSDEEIAQMKEALLNA